MNPDQPWTKRQEIPDPQVKDVADQYESARRVLAALPPGSGVLLPQMNVAVMAIELYLKSLSAVKNYQRLPGLPEVSTVHAVPEVKAHTLEHLLDAIPDSVRSKLESAFHAAHTPQTLRGTLKSFEGLFAASRYPFEPGSDVARYPLDSLMKLAAFLSDFVTAHPASERVYWGS